MKPTRAMTSSVVPTSWGARCIGIVLTFMVAMVLAMTLEAGIANAATFTVTNTNNGGAGSLRQAILNANASPNAGGADRIEFNIPAGTNPGCDAGSGVCTISPTGQLPDITGAVVVDGYTQSGASPNTLATGSNAQLKIRLNGSVAGLGTNGITITGPSSVVKGLVINGWDGTGVLVDATGVSNNRIQGNYIGTDSSGTQDVPNEVGVEITGGTNTLVGGPSTGARNIISGNEFGVFVADSEASRIERNYIGTDASGQEDLGNDSYGVAIAEASDNVIGGTSAAARNVISGNGDSGIFVLFSESSGNRIEGNYVGTNASGTQDLRNDGDGVEISGATNTVVGGSVTGARNVISGNGDAGVAIRPANEGGPGGSNRIEGNYIGTNAAGTADIGNGLGGVFIEDVTNNVVGGASAAAANLISNNGGDGVEVAGNLATGNRILRNSIFDNEGLGIDLDGGNQNPSGVTANDPLDPDNGENLLQNYPIITSAGQSTIQGTLNSNPSNTFTIRFYSSPTADPSGFGEGKTYIGQRNVSTNASGNASFTLTSNTPLAPGQVVTATATNRVTGNTSEFSQAVQAGDNTPPTVVSTNPQDGATGVPAAINVTAIFSEPMDPATINNTTFKLFKKVGTSNQLVPATVTYSPSNRRATLNPNALLDRGATYLAQVTTGAKDKAGNSLAQRKDFTFTVNP